MKTGGLLIAAIMMTGLMPLSALASNGNGNQAQPCAACGAPGVGMARQYMAQETEQIAERVSNENQFRNMIQPNFDEQREKFKQAKEQFKQRAMDENQFRVHVQNYLQNSIDKIDSMALRIRDRVQDRDFDQFLNQTRQRLRNMTSKPELISAAKEIKDAWKQFRVRAKWKINDEASGKLNGIILNANGLARKLDLRLQYLESQGKNVSDLREKLSDFEEKVQLAYGNWTMAHQLLRSASNNTGNEAVLDEAHSYLRASHANIKDAHNILKYIASELKNRFGPPLLPPNKTEDGTAPLVTVLSPSANQTLCGQFLVNASVTDNESALFTVRYALENSSWLSVWHPMSNGTSAGYQYWTAIGNSSAYEDGEYLLRIRAVDTAHNENASETVAVVLNSTSC